MKVTIEHKSKWRLFGANIPTIVLTTELTNLEKAIIKKNGLEDRTVYEAPVTKHLSESMQGPTLVRYLGKPLTLHYDDLGMARQEEEKLRACLVHFKQVLDSMADPVAKSSFEL